jgi:ketosteroid isomerase-like protein
MSGAIVVFAFGMLGFLAPKAPPAPIPIAVASRQDITAELLAVIERALEAQTRFDPAALARVLAPEYVEISPVGEVDHRDAVLGFYNPANRGPAPAVAVEEPLIRHSGSTAVAIVQLAFSPPDQAAPRAPMRMRATYVMRRGPAGWLIASAQFTAVR